MSNHVILLCATLASSLVTANASGALQAPTLESRKRATTAAHAEFTRIDSLVRAGVATRIALPPVRNYAGMVVRADTAAIAPAFLPGLDSAFATVFREARAAYGAIADTMLASATVTLTPRAGDEHREGGPDLKGWVFMQGSGRFGGGSSLEYAAPPSQWNLEAHFVGWFGLAAYRRLPEPLRRWAASNLPLRPNYDFAFRDAYVTLALNQTRIASGCLGGALFACRTALAIVAGNDTLSAWYTPDERRDLARGILQYYRFRERRSAFDQCVAQGVDSVCRALIIEAGWFGRRPTDNSARKHFLRAAITRGGPDGYARIVTHKSTDIQTLIEAAAGVPVDTLVSDWRAGLLASRVPSPAPNGAELLGGVLLAAFFVGFSSRNRP